MTMTIGAVIVVVVLLAGIGGFGLLLFFDDAPQYPSEAAEAPEPDVEFERARPLTEVGPLVVAGSDLDLTEARVNLIFATLTLPYADDATEYAKGVVGLYVAPEVDR